MKKTLISIFAIGLFAIAGTAFAQMGMMGNYYQQNGTPVVNPSQNSALNTVLQDIYKAQNVSGQAQLECAKLTDDQLEKLGDAYMGVMAGTEQQHQVMEQMMGGEGSATLRQAHINMGRSYLGCWSGYSSGPVIMPMMGDMMGAYGPYGNYPTGYYPGNSMMGRFSMMSGYYGGYAWFCWITIVLVWTLLILGIIALVKWLRKS